MGSQVSPRTACFASGGTVKPQCRSTAFAREDSSAASSVREAALSWPLTIATGYTIGLWLAAGNVASVSTRGSETASERYTMPSGHCRSTTRFSAAHVAAHRQAWFECVPHAEVQQRLPGVDASGHRVGQGD